MQRTMTSRSAQGENKPFEPSLKGLIGAVPKAKAFAQATLKDFEGGKWLLDCAARALDRTMSRKLAAATMKEDQGQMTNELKALGHMSLLRVGLLPLEFFENWIDEIRQHFKLDNDEERLKRARELRAKCDEVIDEIARKGLR